MVDRGDTCGVIYIESVYFTALSSFGEGSWVWNPLNLLASLVGK